MKVDLNIQNKKIELIQWLSTVEDPSVLDKVIELRKNESKDWYNSVDQREKDSIEKGIEDANSGKLNPHSKARALYGKWL